MTSIQNSFVQCTMRASMKEPVNNKQLLPFSVKNKLAEG